MRPIRLRQWIVQYPLATTQRILHIVFPETTSWGFRPDAAPEPDEELVAFYTWESRSRQRQILNTTLAVMVLPPWIASSADLMSMTKCRKVCSTILSKRKRPHMLSQLRRRRFPEDPDPQWTACERLWAKVRPDVCATVTLPVIHD